MVSWLRISSVISEYTGTLLLAISVLRFHMKIASGKINTFMDERQAAQKAFPQEYHMAIVAIFLITSGIVLFVLAEVFEK